MANDLRIALVQTTLHWEDPTANRAMLEEKIANIGTTVDLIVLPEMFTTGFTMNPAAVSEPPHLTTHKWMQQIAKRTKAVVTGSYVVTGQGQFHNRLLWMRPDGTFSTYDKRHLFRMGREHEHYAAGQKRLVEELKGWKICPMICYDLRFPVWARNRHLEYDVLLYVANWPAVRSHVWRTLLTARAIENLSYTLGVNRVGADANNIPHDGQSVALDFRGNVMIDAQDQDQIVVVTLKMNDLKDFREKFPAYLDADDFEIAYS